MKTRKSQRKTVPTRRLVEFSPDNHLPTKKTGLPFIVWIWPRGNVRHDVRVGVALGPEVGNSKVASVAIRPDVRVVKGTMGGSEFAVLRQWIDVNQDVIVKYWGGQIWCHSDAAAAIQQVRCKAIRKKLSERDEGEAAIFEFTGLDSVFTNLPFFVWVQPSMGARTGVRVGVSHAWNVSRADLVSVAISPEVQVVKGELASGDLALVRRWVNMNRDVIIKYWDGEEIVYSSEVFAAVKRLPGKNRPLECTAPTDDDDLLFEFTDLAPEKTGLPFYVWVQPSMGARHGVRVGVSYDNRGVGRRDLMSVAIRPNLSVVKGKLRLGELVLLGHWVDLNRDLIVKHWNSAPGFEDSCAVYDRVKSLP